MGFKAPFKSLLSCVMGTMVINVPAAVDPAYEVGTWAHFRTCAVTHGFDDNMNLDGPGQDIFDERGFHMTLHVQTGATDWTKCKASFAKGHEISSHTVSHTGSDAECRQSWEAITTNVPGEKCITIAYPDCNIPDPQINLKKYFVAGRNCDGKVNDKTPSDWYQISSKMFGSGQCGCPNDAPGLNGFAYQAASKNGWAVYCHHGIGNESHTWAVTSLGAMETHLDYLDKNRDTYWVETFGNVARYIKERDAVSITQKDSGNRAIIVEVTDTLDNEIYSYPLSIRRLVPCGWYAEEIDVYQNQKNVKDTIVTDGSKKVIMFKAVPDGGEVLISSGAIASERHGSTFSTRPEAAIVRLRGKTLLIDRAGFSGTNLSVAIFDLRGKSLARHALGGNESQILLPADKISRSAFLVRINDGGTTCARTFMPQR